MVLVGVVITVGGVEQGCVVFVTVFVAADIVKLGVVVLLTQMVGLILMVLMIVWYVEPEQQRYYHQ